MAHGLRPAQLRSALVITLEGGGCLSARRLYPLGRVPDAELPVAMLRATAVDLHRL